MSLKISAKNGQGFDKVKLDAVKKVTDSIKKNDLQRLGDFVADMIRKRTRLGYGVSETGGERSKLKELKGRPKPYSSTIRGREYLKENGELSSLTTPTKSNLTATGRMLDSIKAIVRGLGVTILIPNSSRPDSKATNRDIAKWNEEKGRPFFNLSGSEIRQLKNEVVKMIKNGLKRSA